MLTDIEVYERLVESTWARPISFQQWMKETGSVYKDREKIYWFFFVCLIVCGVIFDICALQIRPEFFHTWKGFLLGFMVFGMFLPIPILLIIGNRNSYRESYDSSIFCTIGKVYEKSLVTCEKEARGRYAEPRYFEGLINDFGVSRIIIDDEFCTPLRFRVVYEKGEEPRTINWLRSFYRKPATNDPNDDNVYLLFRLKGNQLQGVGYCDYEKYREITGHVAKREHVNALYY